MKPNMARCIHGVVWFWHCTECAEDEAWAKMSEYQREFSMRRREIVDKMCPELSRLVTRDDLFWGMK